MKMKKLVLAVVVASSAAGSTARGALVSYYNFNGLAIATASTPGSGGVPTSITADQGSGTLSLTGFAGTVDDFGGTTLNALNADPAEESLSLVAGGNAAPFPGNGGYIQLNFATTGLQDVVVTFATRGTATGFNSGIFSYSTDGTNFTDVPGNFASTSGTFALATVDFSAVPAIDNQAAVQLRYTVSGATSGTGNNRIDNLQINAAEVPEPTIMALVLCGGLGLATVRRRVA